MALLIQSLARAHGITRLASMALLKEANAMSRRQVCLILAGILTLSIPAGGGFSQVIRRPGSETQSTQPQQWTGRAKFTHWDDLAIGTLGSASKAAWVIAIDDDAPGDLGRFYIRGGKTNGIAQQFDAFYTKFDRIAIGDVLREEAQNAQGNEIVVASLSVKSVANPFLSRALLNSVKVPLLLYTTWISSPSD